MQTFADLKAEIKRRAIRDQGGTQYDATVGNLINSSLFRIGREALWRSLRRTSKFTTVTSYTTGSGAVSVTNGSKNFSVTGATFLTDAIRIGRKIEFGTSSKTYEIATITSETAGTLTQSYEGTTSTTTSYEILPQEEYNFPAQVSHRMFLWHDDYGYPFKMEYVTDQEFRDAGVDDAQVGTPVLYRMWGEDMVLAQPVAASVMTVSSSSASDTTQTITIFGTVSGYPDFESINLNGTSTVAGSKSFSSIERVVKSASTTGRITVTSNSAAVTVSVLPVGDTTAGILYRKAQLWPLPQSVMDIKVQYYKDVYRLVNDNDVHELGQEFDEAIILLCVGKLKYQDNQKEGDRFISLYTDELKSLKRTNVDKIDHFVKLRKPNQGMSKDFLTKNLNFSQLGGAYGPMWRR